MKETTETTETTETRKIQFIIESLSNTLNNEMLKNEVMSAKF